MVRQSVVWVCVRTGEGGARTQWHNAGMSESSASPETAVPHASNAVPPRQRIGPLQLFIAFSTLTLSGFGGVLPFAYRALVEQKRWLGKTEFVELFAMAQLLPGPPILHLAQMIGHRDSGWRGGVAAIAGIIVFPTLLMGLLGLSYEHLAGLPAFGGAVSGMSAAAVALIIVMTVRISSAVPRRVMPGLLVAAAFIALGLLRLPFVNVVLVLTPIGVALAWKKWL